MILALTLCLGANRPRGCNTNTNFDILVETVMQGRKGNDYVSAAQRRYLGGKSSYSICTRHNESKYFSLYVRQTINECLANEGEK